jgi:hypothetical protein
VMFSYIQKPDKKYLTTDLFMFSLPVGYSNSADLYLIRKCNLSQGLSSLLEEKIVPLVMVLSMASCGP